MKTPATITTSGENIYLGDKDMAVIVRHDGEKLMLIPGAKDDDEVSEDMAYVGVCFALMDDPDFRRQALSKLKKN